MNRAEVAGLYLQHRDEIVKAIHRYAPGLANSAAMGTDDVVQETFSRLLQYGASDSSLSCPRSYLLRMAVNVTNSYFVRKSQRQLHLQIDRLIRELIIDSEQEPPRLYEWRQFRGRIEHCLDLLSARQRDILFLSIHRDLTQRQIADHVGVTERIVIREVKLIYGLLRGKLVDHPLADAMKPGRSTLSRAQLRFMRRTLRPAEVRDVQFRDGTPQYEATA